MATQRNEIAGLIKERTQHVIRKKDNEQNIACDTASVAGAVSQRACVYSGARVVLNPITDVLHLVHGPIGCASYTTDIRGSRSSGSELYRKGFSTDLKEKDIIFGGEKKLFQAIKELVNRYEPAAVFVYATCTIGIIGDDLKAVCKKAQKATGVKVIPVQSEGFRGNKASGYKAACDALITYVIGSTEKEINHPFTVNILGDFNIAGDLWPIKAVFESLGIKIISSITGDGKFDEICLAHKAKLNLVQCSGSLTYLAKKIKDKYGIPFKRISFYGLEEFSQALLFISNFFGSEEMAGKAKTIIAGEKKRIEPQLSEFKNKIKGKKAAIYMGGAAKALALIKNFKMLGVKTVLVGTQSGKKDEYKEIQDIVPSGTVIIDDANPLELMQLLKKQKADILVGGVKERYLAYKLGIPFCDYNHDRKIIFEGYDGIINFAQEVYETLNSPVFKLPVRMVKK